MIEYHSSCIRVSDKNKAISKTGLQTVDYQYNIRSWMTKINDPLNLGTDLFGYKINYNQREGLEIPNSDFPDLMVKPKFNGNIAEVSWKTQTEDNEPLKRYGYVYDGLNRLSAGFYQKAGYESSKEYFEKMTYDLEGNISRLQRSAGLSAGLTTALAIDNLKYDYEGNKLTYHLDGFQYITSPTSANGFGFKFVPTSEGYFDFINNVYIYNYTDHLGNVRLSYHKDYLGNAYANEENNYYPFGLKHEGYNNLGGNGSYAYKYNNKELQLETGMYDYGARFYMPVIGRWGGD